MSLDNWRFILQLLNHNCTSHFKLNCFEIKKHLNLNSIFFSFGGIWTQDLPLCSSSSNLIFQSLSLLLFWPYGKIGWLKLVQFSPTSYKSSVRVPNNLHDFCGEGWLHPDVQLPLSYSMGLQPNYSYHARHFFSYFRYRDCPSMTSDPLFPGPA